MVSRVIHEAPNQPKTGTKFMAGNLLLEVKTMSKNVKAAATTTANNTEVETVKAPEPATVEVKKPLSLKEYFEQYPNVSLRKIAAATDVNYGVLLKKSKDPVPGQAYDPDATNWMALEATLARKNIKLADLKWDELNEGPARHGAQLEKDMEVFTVGKEVYLRRNNDVPYVIVYKTATHIVLQLKGTQEPIVWANNTFLINGPVFTPRATKTESTPKSETTGA